MAITKKKVIPEEEVKEILRRAAHEVQLIDERIEALKEQKKEIFKNVKDQGLSIQLLKKAIKRLREIKKAPSKEEELNLYMDAVEEVVEPLK